MAQKDPIFGGIRGSSERIKPSDPLWKDILVFAGLIVLMIACVYVVGGIK